MGEKITIKKSDDNYLIVEDNLSSLSTIRNMIVKNEFEEVARNILEKNRTESSINFFINKQAAYNNLFHMIDENMSPLGDIEIIVKSNDIEEVIEWITS